MLEACDPVGKVWPLRKWYFSGGFLEKFQGRGRFGLDPVNFPIGK